MLCADGTYYCGITKDIKRRIGQHNNGTASRYTRGRGPVTLITKSLKLEKSKALSLEAAVKKVKKLKKKELIKTHQYKDSGKGFAP